MILILILLTLIILIYLKINRFSFNLISLYLISFLIFYVAYPLSDIIRGNYTIYFYDFFTVYLYLGLTLFIFIFLFKLLINKESTKFISFKTLILQANNISYKQITSIFIIPFFLICFFFVKYSLIFRGDSGNLADTSFYNTMSQTFIVPFLFILEIIIVVKLYFSKIKGTKRFISLCILSFCFLFFLFYGRRELILFILILIFLISTIKKIDLFRIRKLISYAFIGFLIIIFSNFYQNIRVDIWHYSVTKEFKLSKSIIDLFFDFNASNDNLDKRTSTLYLFNKVLPIAESNNSYSNGTIFLNAINTLTPSFLLENKKVINVDDKIASNFGISPTDYTTTIPMVTFFDFGFYSFILYPLYFIVIFVIVLTVLKHYRNNPLPFVFFFTLFLLDLYNIEGAYERNLNLFRDFIMYAIVFSFIKFKKFNYYSI